MYGKSKKRKFITNNKENAFETLVLVHFSFGISYKGRIVDCRNFSELFEGLNPIL